MFVEFRAGPPQPPSTNTQADARLDELIRIIEIAVARRRRAALEAKLRAERGAGQ